MSYKNNTKRSSARKSKRKEKKQVRTKLGWVVSSKYTTTSGPQGELCVLCTECTQQFTPNGILLRKKAAAIDVGTDSGVFLCPNCLSANSK